MSYSSSRTVNRLYLANKEAVERGMVNRLRQEEDFIKARPPLPPELRQMLERAREQTLSRSN